jgi:hypothetical protein
MYILTIHKIYSKRGKRRYRRKEAPVQEDIKEVIETVVDETIVDNPIKTINLAESIDWRYEFQGTWRQCASENFDEFLIFSGTTFVVRKLAPLMFFKVRHTFTITPQNLHYLRDFGDGIKEWKLDFKIKNKDDAESVYSIVDTGEYYYFTIWFDDNKKEFLMKSIPECTTKGVIVVHTRTLIDNNNMKMVCNYNMTNCLHLL